MTIKLGLLLSFACLCLADYEKIPKRSRIIIELSKHCHTGYQWSIFPPDIPLDKICANKTCRDGGRHTICKPRRQPAKNCEHFTLLKMDFNIRRRFVMSHNGLRNRVSKMSGWFATNMNYLVSFHTQIACYLIHLNVPALGS